MKNAAIADTMVAAFAPTSSQESNPFDLTASVFCSSVKVGLD
ncbi:TPA: hypothetical protein ACRGFM_004665 [Klebsiella pneumoniae]